MEISQPFPVTSDWGGMNRIFTGLLYHATFCDKVTDTLWRQWNFPLLGVTVTDHKAN